MVLRLSKHPACRRLEPLKVKVKDGVHYGPDPTVWVSNSEFGR